MKKVLTTILCITLIITLFNGCGGNKKQIPVFTGEWKQSNTKSNDGYQLATISGDTIEIYFASDNGNTKSLYWVGSFIPPTTTEEPYIWTSKNDHAKTDKSLLGSTADTKVMTYENGTLSYNFKIMGTSTTVNLKKQK